MAKEQKDATLPSPQRKITPPFRDAMNLPVEAADTYEVPPKSEITGPDIETGSLGAVVDQGQGLASVVAAAPERILSEPIATGGERMVWVKPNTTFRTFIGDRWYTFQKNVPARVTDTIRQILGKASKIYP